MGWGPWRLGFGPLGAMFVIMGVSHFLNGPVPEGILIPVELALFAAATVWFVRGYRTSRARIRELLRQRGRS
jgi:hypothetical protein